MQKKFLSKFMIRFTFIEPRSLTPATPSSPNATNGLPMTGSRGDSRLDFYTLLLT